MKKTLLALVLALAAGFAAHAQIGVIGGWTTSKTNIDGAWNPDVKNMSLYHLGVAYNFDLGPFFSLLPALAYQVKGSTVSDLSGARTLASKAGYLELELGMQLGLDLLILRPFFLFEPFVGYQVIGDGERLNVFSLDSRFSSSSYNSSDLNRYLDQAKNKFEVGFGVGGGVELLKHLQFSVQWFMNVGKLYDGNKLAKDAVASYIVDNYKDLKNYSGVKITLGLFF